MSANEKIPSVDVDSVVVPAKERNVIEFTRLESGVSIGPIEEVPELEEKIVDGVAVTHKSDNLVDNRVDDLIDELTVSADRELMRRIKYRDQIVGMVRDQAQLIVVLTSVAECLGVKINTSDGEKLITRTDVIGKYTQGHMRQIGGHILVAVEHLLQEKDLGEKEIKKLKLERDAALKGREDIKSNMESVHGAQMNVMQENLERAKGRAVELLKEVQQFSVSNGAYFLAIPSSGENPERYLEFKQIKEGVVRPSLTTDQSRAVVYESEDEAYEDRARLIRAVRAGNVKFHAGLANALRLEIASRAVWFGGKLVSDEAILELETPAEEDDE